MLAGDFALPETLYGGFSNDEQGNAEFRALVRSFCALGTRALTLLSEAVEHQEITREKLSKSADDIAALGLLIVYEGDDYLQLPHRMLPSFLGEDVLLTVDMILEAMHPSEAVVMSPQTTLPDCTPSF